MTTRSMRVVVAGAGICGLATGVLLGRAGAQVTLIGRGDGSDRGGALLLQPNGLAVLRALGLDQERSGPPNKKTRRAYSTEYAHEYRQRKRMEKCHGTD